MAKNTLQDDIASLATDIRQQGQEIRATLFLSLAYTGDLLNRYLKIELDKRDSNRTNFNILHNLVTHNGKMTGTELAKSIFRSKYAVSRAIDALEADGLVKRKKSGADRRETKILITRKGVDFVKDNMIEGQKISLRAMSVLTQKQVDELRVILNRLRKNLQDLISSGRQKK